MSLVISLRVADGIVVAADSLSLSQSLLEFVAQDLSLQCPHCKKEINEQGLKLPPLAVPFSASSYTQKLYSLYDDFALAAFGQGIINKRSIYYHVQQFEKATDKPADLGATRDALAAYMEKELVAQFPRYKDDAPDNWYPVGFHLNGCEEENGQQVAVTYEVLLGRDNIIRRRAEIGCTIGGDMKVVQKLWEIGKEDPRNAFKYNLLSLQDAIDLSEYLIMTTSGFQRFANEVPSVGGEVDIALVTPFHGFQWIKRKELMRTLEEKR